MVDKLLYLNALLRIYNSNFLNLHWNSVGEEFNDAHKSISTDYYELCDKYIDATAEMICRLGKNPYNYIEAYNAVIDGANNDEVEDVEESGYKSLLMGFSEEYINNILIVDSSQLYNRSEIIKIADKMLYDIVNAITACLSAEGSNDVINAGIKSDLEAMLGEFDIQYRYINKRRMA